MEEDGGVVAGAGLEDAFELSLDDAFDEELLLEDDPAEVDDPLEEDSLLPDDFAEE